MKTLAESLAESLGNTTTPEETERAIQKHIAESRQLRTERDALRSERWAQADLGQAMQSLRVTKKASIATPKLEFFTAIHGPDEMPNLYRNSRLRSLDGYGYPLHEINASSMPRSAACAEKNIDRGIDLEDLHYLAFRLEASVLSMLIATAAFMQGLTEYEMWLALEELTKDVRVYYRELGYFTGYENPVHDRSLTSRKRIKQEELQRRAIETVGRSRKAAHWPSEGAIASSMLTVAGQVLSTRDEILAAAGASRKTAGALGTEVRAGADQLRSIRRIAHDDREVEPIPQPQPPQTPLIDARRQDRGIVRDAALTAHYRAEQERNPFRQYYKTPNDAVFFSRQLGPEEAWKLLEESQSYEYRVTSGAQRTHRGEYIQFTDNLPVSVWHTFDGSQKICTDLAQESLRDQLRSEGFSPSMVGLSKISSDLKGPFLEIVKGLDGVTGAEAAMVWRDLLKHQRTSFSPVIEHGVNDGQSQFFNTGGITDVKSRVSHGDIAKIALQILQARTAQEGAEGGDLLASHLRDCRQELLEAIGLKDFWDEENQRLKSAQTSQAVLIAAAKNQAFEKLGASAGDLAALIR